MQEVVCDTMVWYHIYGEVELQKLSEINCFISTMSNIDDFYGSKKVIDDFIEVQNAIRSSTKYSRFLIPEHPFEYVNNENLLPQFRKQNPENQKGIDFCVQIANVSEISEDNKTIIEREFKNRQDRIGQFVSFINDHSKKRRELIGDLKRNNSFDKKNYRKIDRSVNNRDFIKFTIEVWSKLSQTKFCEEIDWKDLELFENVTNEFFLELELSQKKVDVNDINDWFQLAYVNSKRKYLTKEKNWIRRIVSCGMEKYLMDYSIKLID